MRIPGRVLVFTVLAGCRCSGVVGNGGDAGASDGGSPDSGIGAGDVLGHHGNPTRDGFYVDGSLTKSAIPKMHVDVNFTATTSGQTFSCPLYMADGASGAPTIFVATENDDVFALNALTGAQIWKTSVGTAVPIGEMQCGSIDPMGITGTPVIDPVSRTVFVAALVNSGAGGTTPAHMVFALSVDSGSISWQFDVGATILGFNTTAQGQRGALLFQNGIIYVPYAGLNGDCGVYHGWVISIPATSPTAAKGWATLAPSGSGIWGPSGIASDGSSLFVATGNTMPDNGPLPTVWSSANSEGVLRLDPGVPPRFSSTVTDYFAPTGSDGQAWYDDDQADADLGSSGVVLLAVPGATPAQLAFAIGKTQNAYLLDRTNLGGLGNGLQTSPSATFTSANQVFGSLFAYATPKGSYVGLQETINPGCNNGDVSVFRLTTASPPQLTFAWCAPGGGAGAPIASTSGNLQDVVVWTYGAGSGPGTGGTADETLRAYDGDVGGTPIYSSPALPPSEHWISPIIGGGRIYIAGDGVVTALTVN
jgi:outer membrane protein assembly factor BamB